MVLQYITDSKGLITGVYIPIDEWNNIKDNINKKPQKSIFIPDWQKETVFKRKEKYDAKPSRALDLSSLIEKYSEQINKSVIIPEAKKDIEAIISTLVKKGLNSNNLFIEELINAMIKVEKSPEEAIVNSYQQIQITLFSTFPYMVHFYIDAQTEKIVIFAVCKYVYEHSNIV